ncbi:MAG: mechanosensitive ion channel domain-containing protein, partial [Pseudomonadota bacterium]
INGDEGLVIRLTSRATILLSFDGNHIRIPNATVFKSRIVNYTRNPERRFLFEIGVASDADLATVRQLAQEVISDLPFALVDPAPLTWIDRIGDGAIFLTVTGWIDQRETNLLLAKGEALRKVKAAVEAAGVEVPDTTYRITFGNSLPGSGTALVAEDNGRVPDAGGAKTPDLAKAQAAIEVNDTTQDATAQSLDKIVADERADADKPDLLRENAPEE